MRMDSTRRGWTRFGLTSFGAGAVVVVGACSSAPVEHPPGDGGPSSDTNVSTPERDATASAPFAPYRTGRRLRAEVLRSGDAARFEQFFDTERNELCSFWETSPGEYRCLPTWAVAKYAERECGTPAIAHIWSCSGHIKYAVVTEAPTGCGVQRRVTAIYPVGDVAPAGASYELNEGRCTEAAPPDGFARRTLGPAIPLTEFVKATSAPANVAEDLAVERLVGEDGSELSRDLLIDRIRGGRCEILRVGGLGASSIACIPAHPARMIAGEGPWADAECSAPAALGAAPEGCAPGQVVVRQEQTTGACGVESVSTLAERGEALSTIYSGPECSGGAPGPDAHIFAVGPELPASAFPAIDEMFFGTGPLRTKAFAKAGVAVGRSTFYDTSSESACMPAAFADGKLRCVPDGARRYTFRDHFKDPLCSQPIHVGGPCDTATMLLDGAYGCGEDAHDVNIFPLGAPFELTTYYVKGATCEPITSSGIVAYDVLPPVPASERLAEITRVRE